MSETAISAAFERAGKTPATKRLNKIAAEIMAKSSRSFADDVETFYGRIEDDPDLLRAAFGHLRHKVLGELLRANAPEGRPNANPSNGAGRGQKKDDARGRLAPPAPPPNDRRGQVRGVTHHRVAPASASGPGQTSRDAPPSIARPGREPSKAQRRAMIEAARIGWHATIKNALETLEIASAKRLLGDIRIDTDTELNRGIYASGAEKTILRIVKAFRHRKAAHVAPGMTVRDIMDSATADKMANFAAHVSKHGIEYLSDESLLQELEQYDG